MSQNLMVMANLKAPEMNEGERRAPISVSAVIDRSGSMEGAKLKLMKATLKFVISHMKESDQFGIITYADTVAETLKLTKMDAVGRQRATDAVAKIRADGCTNLSGGLLAGIDQLKGSTGLIPRAGPGCPQNMTIPALKRESRQVTLKVGNEYRALKEEDWTPSQSVPDTMNQHQWTMFVRLAEGEQGQVSDYVCHVEYGLHPTFKQSNVTVGAAPFELTRTGWGTFEVAVRVTLNPKFGSTVHTFRHMLNFHDPETSSNHTIPVPSLSPVPDAASGSADPPAPVSSVTAVLPGTKATNEVASVWLFTDGLANVGLRDRARLVRVTENKLKELSMPCSVFSFGFGDDHDAQMLKEIADASKGMYYFVEGENQIAEAFADCLGGLLSVVAQNIRLTLRAQPGCSLQHVYTKYNYALSPTEASVEIPDLYSEEQRDVVVAVGVGPIATPSADPAPILEWLLQYNNLMTCQSDTVVTPALLSRPEVAEACAPSAALDKQRNRVACTAALERSKKAADMGQFEEARSILKENISSIARSHTATDDFCLGLQEDLQDCLDQMVDHRTYKTKGGQTMTTLNSCHSYQRSCGMKGKYTTKLKSAMVSKCQDAMEED
uniref:VWFA domain-containing protein n=1 Tax=Eutreptiella gymnastica TaxID=73025 RepID=A0A7S4LN03_9EUGL